MYYNDDAESFNISYNNQNSQGYAVYCNYRTY
jgi:hypothetical protein